MQGCEYLKISVKLVTFNKPGSSVIVELWELLRHFQHYDNASAHTAENL